MVDVNKNLVMKLKLLMKKKHLNASKLAQRAGVGPSFVYDILNGKSRNPTVRKLQLIADVLGVDLLYFLEDSHNKDFVERSSFKTTNVSLPTLYVDCEHDNTENCFISYKDLKLYHFNRKWIQEKFKVSVESLCIVHITDDVMFPNFLPDDILIINTDCKSDSIPGVFAILDKNKIQVRRLDKSDKSGKIKIMCDNPIYLPRDEKKEKVQIIGKAVFAAKRVI